MQNEASDARPNPQSDMKARDERLAEATGSETLSDIRAQEAKTTEADSPQDDSKAGESGAMPAPEGVDMTTTIVPRARADNSSDTGEQM